MSEGIVLWLVLLMLVICGGLALVVFAERTARGIQEFRDSTRRPQPVAVRVVGVLIFVVGFAGLIAAVGL